TRHRERWRTLCPPCSGGIGSRLWCPRPRSTPRPESPGSWVSSPTTCRPNPLRKFIQRPKPTDIGLVGVECIRERFQSTQGAGNSQGRFKSHSVALLKTKNRVPRYVCPISHLLGGKTK